MNKTKKLGKNILIITIGSFLSKIISFLFLPLYTSVLTTKEYGTADLITTTVNLLVPFATLVMGEALMRYSLGKEDEYKVIFSSGVHACKYSFLLVLLLAPLIMCLTPLKKYSWILAINLFVSCIYNLLSYFSRGIGAVKNYSIAGVINTIFIVIINIFFLVVFKIGLIGYMLSVVFAEMISIVYLLSCKVIIQNISILKSDCKRDISLSMLKYSFPLVPNSISWWISNSSDKYILTLFWGLSLNGIYSVSYKIPSILNLFVSIFSSAWLISAVDDFGSEESKKFYSSIYNKYISISIVGISGLVLINKILSSFLFSSEFYNAWKFQPILIIGIAFHGMAGFLGSIYTSAKKTNMILISTIIGALMNILLNFCLIPKFGAFGAAVATSISYILVWLIRTINSRRIMILSVDWISIIISSIAIIFQLLIGYIVENKFSVHSLILFIFVLIINRKFILLVLNQFIKRVKRTKKNKCQYIN